MEIPAKGAGVESVIEELKQLREGDLVWSKGRPLTPTFRPAGDAQEVASQAFALSIWTNALDPTMTPSVLTLETEIIAMLASQLGGDADTVGNFTSGGTESVMLAVKTARDWARARNPRITRPQLIMPLTAHPCFRKAAHYLDMECTVTPVHDDTFQADVGKMREAITDQTVLLVGSAPCFSPGVMDPIPEIAALAREHDIACHTDGCIGGFILSLYRQLGYPVPEYDFQVPGVTSISLDPHKYGFAPLGASAILFRNAEIRKHVLFTCTGWPGYTMVNPTVQSSRSAGPMAATWALYKHLGLEGYHKIAEHLRQATEKMIEGLKKIEDLKILGQPVIPIMVVASDTVDMFRVSDEMKHRGWWMFPQLKCENIPKSLHLLITPHNAGRVDQWLEDFRESVDVVKSTPFQDELAPLRQAIDSIDFEQVSDAEIMELLGMVGLTGGGMPEDIAGIYGILDDLPTDVTDRVVTLFYNELNRYRPK